MFPRLLSKVLWRQHSNPVRVLSSTTAAKPFVADENVDIQHPTDLMNVLHTFMHCLDSGDADTFVKLFVEDAVVNIQKTHATVEGQDGLKGLCRAIHSMFGPVTMHFEYNCVLRPIVHRSDSSKIIQKVNNRSYWQAIKGADVVSAGVHEDILVLVRGNGEFEKPKWLFQSRDIFHHFTEADGFTNGGRGCLSP